MEKNVQIQSVISDSNVESNHPTMAEPFGKALIELAKDNDKIVGLSADLAKYTDIHVFRDTYPDRFYNVGMSEQLMMCAASGLAKEGFVPFATTYSTFIARRCYDFISQAICEHNTNVKIIGGLPGLQSGYGPSHQATDDLAILRAMPNLVIIDPCDAVDVEQATKAIAEYDGPVKPLDMETIAAEVTKGDRIVVTAENHTVVGGLGEAIASELFRRKISCDFRQISLPDEYLDAGTLEALQDKYGVSTKSVIEQVREWVKGE